MNTIQNKIKSVMIGHAIGDALGVPVEFASREEIADSPVADMRGFGTYPYPAGTWSDDTSMSVAALDSLAEGKIDWDGIMGNFVKWLDSGEYTPSGETFDIGRACLKAITNYVTRDAKVTECGCTSEHSNGNGSLMRIHPFSMMAACKGMTCDEWEGFIDQASALTHAHERSKLACRIYTKVLLALWDAPEKSSVKSALEWSDCKYADSPEHMQYKRLFAHDFDKTPVSEIKSSGYVVDTLEAAIWCLLTTDSYKDCVLKAVNLGEDTDTVGAVAGGLAGALYGYESIPEEWRNTLIKRDYIEKMCERAGKAWV